MGVQGGSHNAKLRADGYDNAAARIYKKVHGRVMYGRQLHVYWSPSRDEVQTLVDGSLRMYDDAIHVNSYRALPGRDDLRVEYIEDDLIETLKRYSRGEK